jgi:hypothetical protein
MHKKGKINKEDHPIGGKHKNGKGRIGKYQGQGTQVCTPCEVISLILLLQTKISHNY